jgi:hypothetical protein
MNYVECIRKVSNLPEGTKFQRKDWGNHYWKLKKDSIGVYDIVGPDNEPRNCNPNYTPHILAEDWEIIGEKPKLTKQEKKPIEYHARIICLYDFDKLQIHFMKKAINPEYHEVTIKLAEALNKATEDFWRNVEIPT